MTLFDNIESGFCLEGIGNIQSTEKIGNPSLVRKKQEKDDEYPKRGMFK